MVTQAEDKYNDWNYNGGQRDRDRSERENSNTPSNTKPFFLLSELETSDINSANVFNSHHKGGRLTFINPHLSVDSTKYPDSEWDKPTQWVTPFDVVDSTKVEIKTPYSILSKQGGDLVIPEEMSNLSFTLSFEPIQDEDSQVTSSIYQASYADITIGNLRTYSGDVHRAKIFSKRQGQTSNAFTKVADFLLQPDNALVNTESVSGRQPIGFFFTQSIVDKYWESSSADVSVTTRDTYLVGGISLSGSNENEGASYTFKTKNNMVFEKREDYEVVFDLQYFKSDKSGSYGSSDDENPENISAAQSHAEIEVFLSGSIESENPDVEYSLGRLSSVPTDPDFTDLLSSESGSIRRVYNIFRTHGLENQISSGSLGFRISSGRFDISNISVSPFADQNFNPGFGKISVPMPLNDEAEVRYDFIAEFYDHNNNKSIQTAQTSASVLFEGPRKVISITGDDVWDGTATMGRSMILHGSNPAFLASVGYKGFEKARAGAAGAADGGLLLFSGSIGSGADTNFLTASEAYDGVGIEIVDASAGAGNPGQHKFLRFRSKDPDNSGNASFRVQTDEFYFGQDRSVAGAQFVSGSGGNIEISSSNFHLLNDGSVVMQGSITATAGGQIGGFTITDKAISTTDFFLSGSTYSGTGFDKTNLVLSSSGFQINSDGQISASEGAIGGFGIGASSLSATGFFISGSSTGTGFADTNLFISSSGFQVNAVGAISASSGTIGGFTITGTELFSLDSGTPDSSPNNGITIDTTGGSNSKAVIRVFDGTTENAALGNYASGKFGIKAIEGEIGAFQISGDSISSTNLFISGSPVAGGVDNTRYMFISTSKFNVKQDGDITGSAVLFEGGKVGGFTIDEDSIEGGNLVLHSAGRVESSDFSSGVMAGSGQGFRLTAEDNGFLEVGNARIRGTLSTAVFEKETVNAVGGILMVGNSTTLSGSSITSASYSTMSVANVSGFTGSYNGFNSSGDVTDATQIDGEILMIKKFSNTGFSTEYVCVQSASFNGDSTAQSNGTDLSGKLYVTRSFSGVAHDGVGSNQAKTGTGGFTGSYLPGGTAQDYPEGQVIVSTGKYFSGTAAGGDISGSGFIMLNAKSTDPFTPYIDIVERTGSQIYSMELKARLGDLSGLSSALVGASPGFGLFSENVFLTGKITATSGEIAGWGLVGNKITSSNGSVELDSTGPGRISLGGTPPTDTTGDGAFLSGSGEFYVGKNNGERLHFNPTGNGLFVSSSAFFLGSKGSSNSYISSSGNNLEISASNFALTNGNITASNVDLSGKITATSGQVGGFSIAPTGLTSTGVGMFPTGQSFAFTAGTGGTPPFRVTHAGALTATAATITGTVNITGGDLAGIDAASISGSGNETSASLAASASSLTTASSSMATQVALTTAGMSLKNSGGTTLASYGTTTTIGPTSGEHISIDSDSIDVKTNASTTIATFGADTTIGNTSAAHLDIKTSGAAGTNGITFNNSSGTDIVFMGNAAEVQSFTGGGGACLLFGSQVSKSDGTIINVEDLEVGDELLSVTLPNATDENVGDWKQDTFNVSSSFNQQTTTIENVSHLTSDHYYNINDSSELITGTHYMLYRVSNSDEWVWEVAPNFEIGNYLMDKNGDEVEITSINRIEGDCNVVSIDTETDDFYVASTFMVHNKGILATGYSVDGIVTNNLVADKIHSTGSADITGSLYAGGLYVSSSTGLATTGSTAVMINVNDGTNEVFQVTKEGEVLARDNITAFLSITSLSDERLKEDIYTLSGSMNKILQLRPTEFTWKENQKQDIGFIAQEVEEIIPEVVHETKGFIDLNSKEQDDTTYKTISYEKLTVYLVDTIKELTKRIEALEKNK